MSLQPIDRQRAKHQHTTSPRTRPALINHSNKTIMPNVTPHAKRLDVRFAYRWW